MIRIVDSVVADWNIFVWEYGGELHEQVEAYLMNGVVLIIDIDDFFNISADDDIW